MIFNISVVTIYLLLCRCLKLYLISYSQHACMHRGLVEGDRYMKASCIYMHWYVDGRLHGRPFLCLFLYLYIIPSLKQQHIHSQQLHSLTLPFLNVQGQPPTMYRANFPPYLGPTSHHIQDQPPTTFKANLPPYLGPTSHHIQGQPTTKSKANLQNIQGQPPTVYRAYLPLFQGQPPTLFRANLPLTATTTSQKKYSNIKS